MDTRRAGEASVEAKQCVGAQALVFFKLDEERLPRNTRKRDVWDVSQGLKLQHDMPLYRYNEAALQMTVYMSQYSL